MFLDIVGPLSLVMGLVAGLWLTAVLVLPAWREWHHFYLGLGLFIAGVWLTTAWLLVAGLVVAGDDAHQHLRQLTERAYRSPLNRLYARVFPHIPQEWRYRLRLERRVAPRRATDQPVIVITRTVYPVS